MIFTQQRIIQPKCQWCHTEKPYLKHTTKTLSEKDVPQDTFLPLLFYLHLPSLSPALTYESAHTKQIPEPPIGSYPMEQRSKMVGMITS